MAASVDRDLLFGLLALQNGLIDQGQLVAAFQAWTRDKVRPLAEHLSARGDLDNEQLAGIEAIVSLHLKKHGSVTERSLAAIPAGHSTREQLAGLGDPELTGVVAHVGPGSTEPDADSTRTFSFGTATSDGQRFRVLRPHAKGGRGAVFVALDGELHREVALKQIQDQYADDPASRARFLIEAEITGGLEHPGIVPIYGLGSYGDGRPYYAMRFVRGDSLKEAIAAFHSNESLKHDPGVRSLELRKLLRRVLDVCNAIEYAHQRGVLHRDLKPGNVMVGKYGETLVVDWGMAKAAGRTDPATGASERTFVPASSSGVGETLPGSAIGTPSYMSPEQASGDLDQLGPRSDVYSLGATIYCVLTGKSPYEGDDVGAVLRSVQKGEFRPPRQLEPSIDNALESVCLKAMALKPEDRYASCGALADDLERWLADEPVTACREPLSRRAGRWARRHRPLVAGAAGLLLTAVVALSVGTVLINRERERAEQSFRQARKAVDDYFTTVSESTLFNVPGLQPLRKDLLDRALKYYQGFIRERGGDRSVRAELAATYWRVGWITGVVGSSEEAVGAYRKAQALYEQLVRDEPGTARFQSDLAIVYNDLGNRLKDLDDRSEALKLHQKALVVREKQSRVNPHRARYLNELAKSHGNLGNVLGDMGKKAEAVESIIKATQLNEQAIAERPIDLGFASDLGTPYNTLAAVQTDLAKDYRVIGNLFAEMNQPSEAIRSYQKSEAIFERVIADHPELDEPRSQLAGTEMMLAFRQKAARRYDEALRHYQKAADSFEQVAARNPAVLSTQWDVAWAYSSIGHTMADSGRPAEALPWIRKARATAERLAAQQPSLPRVKISLAFYDLCLGRLPPEVLPPAESLDCLRRGEKLLASIPNLTAEDRYNLACVRARIFPLIGQGQPRLTPEQKAERGRYEALAMETLHEAVSSGYKDFRNMSTDSDMDSLRSREDFRKLIDGGAKPTQ